MQTKECCAKCFIKETCDAQLTCSEKKDLIIEIVREQELKKFKQELKQDLLQKLIYDVAMIEDKLHRSKICYDGDSKDHLSQQQYFRLKGMKTKCKEIIKLLETKLL